MCQVETPSGREYWVDLNTDTCLTCLGVVRHGHEVAIFLEPASYDSAFGINKFEVFKFEDLNGITFSGYRSKFTFTNTGKTSLAWQNYHWPAWVFRQDLCIETHQSFILTSNPFPNTILNYADSCRVLQDERTTLDGVDEVVTALEVRVAAPAADELKDATLRKSIILGVDVEESNLLDTGTGGVLRDG